MKEQLIKYRITGGKHHLRNRSTGKIEVYHIGAIVELTELQAENFLDKMERVDVNASGTIRQPDIFRAVHTGGNKYDVVNRRTGDVLNTAPLSRDDAFALAAGDAKVDYGPTPPDDDDDDTTTTATDDDDDE